MTVGELIDRLEDFDIDHGWEVIPSTDDWDYEALRVETDVYASGQRFVRIHCSP